jgi:cytochrome c biogenesis protein CcmG, thiol:disulfide interchange protein DsbE
MLRFLMLVLFVPLLAACEGGAPKYNVGSVAPGFSTVYMDGKAVHFPEDFRGKPVVIRFWADWCHTCESEMKTIEKVYQKRHAQGLQVLAVNTGQDKDTVTAFIRKIGISYSSLLDEKADIARQYGVVGLPTTFFVGADGVIKSKVIGEADVAIFDKLAGELIDGTR